MNLIQRLCEPFGGLRTETAKELEKIADNHAIEFAEWININYFVYNTWDKSKTIKELLEIFKKEKGL